MSRYSYCINHEYYENSRGKLRKVKLGRIDLNSLIKSQAKNQKTFLVRNSREKANHDGSNMTKSILITKKSLSTKSVPSLKELPAIFKKTIKQDEEEDIQQCLKHCRGLLMQTPVELKKEKYAKHKSVAKEFFEFTSKSGLNVINHKLHQFEILKDADLLYTINNKNIALMYK